MLETIIKLLERFVVAHELIAANSAQKEYVTGEAALYVANHSSKPVEIKVEGEDVFEEENAEAAEIRAAIEAEEEQERKEKAKERKPRQTKPKDEPKGPDVAKLREEIKTIAKAIAAGDSDECADKFDELLEDYKVRTVTKLADEDVEAFHKDATKLVGKYYEIEE